MSIRDKQFMGAAELLFDGLPWDDINIDMEAKGWEDRWQQVIAQRLYDFALHVMENTSEYASAKMEANLMRAEDWIYRMPDLKEWPKVEGE